MIGKGPVTAGPFSFPCPVGLVRIGRTVGPLLIHLAYRLACGLVDVSIKESWRPENTLTRAKGGGIVRLNTQHALARRVGAVAAFGALVLALAVYSQWTEPFAGWARVLGVLAAFIAGDLGLVSFREGGSKWSHGWQTTVLVLALILLPLGQLVLVGAASGIAVSAIRRQARLRALFNVALCAIEVAVAGIVSRPVHPYQQHVRWHQVFAPSTLFGIALATLLASLSAAPLVAAVVAAERHRPGLDGIAELAKRALLVWARNFMAALAIVAVLDGAPIVIVGVLAAVVVVHLWTRDRTALGRERQAWQRLQKAIHQLRDVELSELINVATQAASAMMRADAAEIELDARTGHATRLRASDIEAPHEAGETENLHPHAMNVELSTREGKVGTLRLLFAQPVVLTPAEEDTLASFANALAVALANALKFEAIRRDAEERIKAAYVDPVTGLGNLLMLEQEAAPALASLADGHVFAIAVIGLDRFAEVNDLLGAHAADLMLRAVAERLRGVVRRCDVVGRLHGAEYVLLLRELPSQDAAVAQAELAVRSLGTAITAEGLDITLDAHTGVACAPTDGDALADLVRRARLAMYKARSTEVPVYRYRPELEPPALAQIEMLRDLNEALNQHQLVLHYQPKFNLRGGLPTAAEALVRWEHPERGMIPPAEFIPLLERCGLIGNLTRYVLDAAIKECALWYKSGLELAVAINLSARNLLDEDLPRYVLECLARHGLPAERLICEITETAVFSRSPVASGILDQLRAAGIGLSLDDFCTGYSSLSLLQERTIDEIKIDRSFVADLEVGNRTTEIVTALIELAHRCDIVVTAEGIETAEQQQLLTTLGCDYAQGYLLARPMPAEAVRIFFAEALKAVSIRPLKRRSTVRTLGQVGASRWDDVSGIAGTSD